MAHTSLCFSLLSLTSLLFLLTTPQTHAQSAPAPSAPGPINITAILVKGGQYTTFIRLLESTQAADQINNQVNSSRDGMTVFAPTDNAFTNLPPGTMNNLSPQQQVQLIQYHILPKYYSLSDFQTVSNPVRTQASGPDGKPFGLYFSSEGNQVNVSSSSSSSSGGVVTQVNNALRQQSPLAVYQVDKVLVPVEFTEAAAPSPAPPTGKTSSSSSSPETTKSSPAEPAPANDSGRLQLGLVLVAGLGLLCMGLLL